MVKIEESKNFQSIRKLTSSLKLMTFSKKYFFAKTPYIKIKNVLKISRS